MDVNQAFPSKYIKASDLQGRDVNVVIADAIIEEIGQTKDKRLVCYFQGKEKGLVVNRTNALMIADLYGNDTDEWTGKEIVLYSTRVPFQGQMTDAIRVKAPARRATGNGKPQHVVQKREGYELSSNRTPDPIEQATGHPTDDGDEIPF
jgi:hypothetical protein